MFTQFSTNPSSFFSGIFQTIGRPSRALMLPHTLIGSALKFVPVADAMLLSMTKNSNADDANNQGKVVGVAIQLQNDVSFEQVTLRHANNIQRALLQQQFNNNNQNGEWIARICAALDGRVFIFLMVDAVKVQEQSRQEDDPDEVQTERKSATTTSKLLLIPRPPTSSSRKNQHQRRIHEESVTDLQARLTLTAAHVLKKRHQEARFNAVAGFSVADVKVVLQEQRRNEMLKGNKVVAKLVAEQSRNELDDEETLEVLVGEILAGSCSVLKTENGSRQDDDIEFVDFLPG